MARRLAWGLAGWSGVLLLAAGVLHAVRGAAFVQQGGAVPAVAITVLGAFVAARQPRNPIGWSFLAAGLSFSYGSFATEYAVRAIVDHPGSLPLATWVAWAASSLSWISIWVPILLIPYTFPTGRLLSKRWIPGLVIGLLGVMALNVGSAFAPEIQGDLLHHVHNPLSWPAFYHLINRAGNVLWTLPFLSLLVGGANLVVRFRRSRGIERQQLKWIMFSGVFVLAGSFGLLANTVLRVDALARLNIFGVLIGVGLGSMPLTVSIAILRYRLYDVDRFIRRTVAYLIVTALLASLYAVVALTPALAFRSREIPNAFVAVGTLVAAMAFVPVRRRVQNIVDRRFNRARYDAAQTIDRFAARVRLEVDVDAMGAELATVVRDTMQPSSVGLWLRSS
jgi:hypothetical protein